ncbi:hypothetical protein SDC9_108807 [bioreactor metagenome]|uniref:Uncharacterized protein n=1 Tax=bioreactor metagenome TaxID=1076179 RepID=A0A645BFI2_9ZZZZ
MTDNNQKPFDLMVEDLKANIYNTLNASGLPMSVIQLVMNDINKEVKEQHIKRVQQLIVEEQNKQSQKPLEAEVVEVQESKEV